MNDFTIRRVTDPKEGPIDGVSAETVGVYTKFRGKGLFQAEKRIIKQETTDVGIKAAVSTGGSEHLRPEERLRDCSSDHGACSDLE